MLSSQISKGKTGRICENVMGWSSSKKTSGLSLQFTPVSFRASETLTSHTWNWKHCFVMLQKTLWYVFSLLTDAGQHSSQKGTLNFYFHCNPKLLVYILRRIFLQRVIGSELQDFGWKNMLIPWNKLYVIVCYGVRLRYNLLSKERGFWIVIDFISGLLELYLHDCDKYLLHYQILWIWSVMA